MDVRNRPYNLLLTDTTAVYVNLRKYATPTDFAVAADWTPATGDVKVSKDGGAAANIGTLPSYVTDKGWKFILTATELSAQQIVVRIADSATKVVCDYVFYVETFGDPSAMYPDPSASDPVVVDVAKIAGSATPVDNLSDAFTGVGYDLSDSTISLSSAERAAIVDAVFDEVASGHTVVGTIGALLQAPNGVAQSAGASTIVIAASESATDDIYNGRLIKIVAGTGAGQTRRITDYVGSSKTVTVDLAWTSTPDSTSRYVIV